MVWRVNLDGDRDGLLIRFALKGVRFDSDALLFNRNMENKIKDFESKHKLFFDYLLDGYARNLSLQMKLLQFGVG